MTMGDAHGVFIGPGGWQESFDTRVCVRHAIEAVLLPDFVEVDMWNDMPDRAFDDVIDMLDRAEKWAEENYETGGA